MLHVMTIALSEIDNYFIAKSEQIWGIKAKHKIQYNLSVGDEILFVVGLHCLSDITPKGFPKLKSYEGLDVQIEELWRVRVLSELQLADPSLFGEEYTYFFNFDIMESTHDFPLSDLSESIQEGINRLFLSNKKIIKLQEMAPVLQ